MNYAPTNGIVGWGADLRQEDRPGVPQELTPHLVGSAPSVPEQQHHGRPTAIDARRPVTPVYGTSIPKRGLSGLLRGAAYAIPPYKPRRWMMLMMADRVDVIEHNIVPFAAVALGIGAVAFAGVLAVRALRD